MRTIETTIDIDATPETVWETLLDFESYPEWNSFVTEIRGTAREGERLGIRIQPPESRGMSFSPRVTAAVPGERLEWLGSLGVRGLFDGRHEFKLEPLNGDRTRFVHRESFAGLLVGLFLDEADTRNGFERMNEQLKARVEGTVAGADGASQAEEPAA